MNLTLETDRLLLRPLELSDAEVEIEMGMDPDVMRFIGGMGTRDKIARAMHKYIRRCAHGCIGIWCIVDRTTGEKLGTAALLPLPIEEDDTNWDLLIGDELPDAEIEVGFLLRRSAWGKGYATEACKRLLRFAFEETSLSEIVGIVDEKNTASSNALQKSGLSYDGIRRAYAEDCPSYRITRQQWLERNS